MDQPPRQWASKEVKPRFLASSTAAGSSARTYSWKRSPAGAPKQEHAFALVVVVDGDPGLRSGLVGRRGEKDRPSSLHVARLRHLRDGICARVESPGSHAHIVPSARSHRGTRDRDSALPACSSHSGSSDSQSVAEDSTTRRTSRSTSAGIGAPVIVIETTPPSIELAYARSTTVSSDPVRVVKGHRFRDEAMRADGRRKARHQRSEGGGRITRTQADIAHWLILSVLQGGKRSSAAFGTTTRSPGRDCCSLTKPAVCGGRLDPPLTAPLDATRNSRLDRGARSRRTTAEHGTRSLGGRLVGFNARRPLPGEWNSAAAPPMTAPDRLRRAPRSARSRTATPHAGRPATGPPVYARYRLPRASRQGSWRPLARRRRRTAR